MRPLSRLLAVVGKEGTPEEHGPRPLQKVRQVALISVTPAQ